MKSRVARVLGLPPLKKHLLTKKQPRQNSAQLTLKELKSIIHLPQAGRAIAV